MGALGLAGDAVEAVVEVFQGLQLGLGGVAAQQAADERLTDRLAVLFPLPDAKAGNAQQHGSGREKHERGPDPASGIGGGLRRRIGHEE
jgi:hypothetical protein